MSRIAQLYPIASIGMIKKIIFNGINNVFWHINLYSWEYHSFNISELLVNEWSHNECQNNT